MCDECRSEEDVLGNGLCREEWRQKKKWKYGCMKEGRMSKEVQEVMKRIDEPPGGEDMTARELMEALTAKDEKANNQREGRRRST